LVGGWGFGGAIFLKKKDVPSKKTPKKTLQGWIKPQGASTCVYLKGADSTKRSQPNSETSNSLPELRNTAIHPIAAGGVNLIQRHLLHYQK
jgi:hypothetical protein